ncbi:MAG: hypothetical protein ABSA76_04410 [Bacteroidales bacterium]
MDVQKSTDRVSFNAVNKSYYPYDLTISFSDLQNLFPRVFERDIILHPGYNNLFILNISDKEQPIQYEYKITYNIKLPNNPDLTFPYLVPIGAGKTVKLESIKNDNGEMILINHFKMTYQDTVFAIRKGTVTALPDNNSEVERIIKSSSLEILHSDGTIAIYRGLDQSFKHIYLGQIVYPGQPIGMINQFGILTLDIVAMRSNSILKGLEICFSDQNGNVISQNLINGSEVFFPKEIIKKEMTDKEIRKYEKGNLY